jgi:hypothetical protein
VRTLQRNRTPTAFSGLGVDLSRTAAAAQVMDLRRLDAGQPRAAPPGEGPPGAWGFGLMLMLNRETGGS